MIENYARLIDSRCGGTQLHAADDNNCLVTTLMRNYLQLVELQQLILNCHHDDGV